MFSFVKMQRKTVSMNEKFLEKHFEQSVGNNSTIKMKLALKAQRNELKITNQRNRAVTLEWLKSGFCNLKRTFENGHGKSEFVCKTTAII